MIFICYLDFRKSEKGEEKRIYNASEKRLEQLKQLEFDNKIMILEIEKN